MGAIFFNQFEVIWGIINKCEVFLNIHILRCIMPNLIWYICLAAVCLASTAWAIYVKREVYKVSTLLVFFMLTASCTWIGEFIVLGLFDAYSYKTGVYDNVWAQNLLGHLILNTTLYPSTAIVMVAFSLRFGWIFCVAAFFSLLEFLFVKIHLYEQHWWNYYMTPIVVVIFLLLSKSWFNNIKNGCIGAIRILTFYFVAMLIIHSPAPILLLMGKQYYHLNFINRTFEDKYLSSIIIIFFYHLLEALFVVQLIRIKRKSYWWILPFIISISIQSMFAKLGILVLEDGWKLIYTLIIYEVCITLFILIENYTLKKENNTI